MKPEDTLNYVDQDPLRRAEQRLGRPAGIFVLDGSFHVANFASRAASDLRDRGAVLVATLLWSEAEAERTASGGAPRPRGPSLVRPHPTAAHVERPTPN